MIENSDEECFYSVALFYLRLIEIVLFFTAILKFLAQFTLAFNFCYLLMHRLLGKHRVEEEKMNSDYEKAQQNILHTHIRAKIEENDKRLADNINRIESEEFSFDMSKYSFPKRKLQAVTTQNPYDVAETNTASISMYDLTSNDKSDLNDDEITAIDAIEQVNNMNEAGFSFSTYNSNNYEPKFDTFKKKTFK